MPAASRNALTEFLFRIHPHIYRRTGGRIGGRLGRLPILLLNTTGRKSGLPRTNGLMYVPWGDSWAVAASWAGEPKHPLWYRNLMAQPETTIEVQGREIPVVARDLEGAERDTVWQAIVAQDPGFAVYEERTRGVRRIPVVLLERRPVRILYGLSCSYFTGKLQAYFQAKGIPYHFVEMNRTQFRMCAQATGVMQLPCVQEPDGSWLTDTTPIMARFEQQTQSPLLSPRDAAVGFMSRLFEDLFDEWFWRPALYYRWAKAPDARLMSTELGAQMLRDTPLPLFLRRWFILARQRIVYLRKDGVNRHTSPLIEKLYLDTLAELDTIFARRPFLFGERPCEADFGLFRPFFRHFFCDPTPGGLMLKHAPHVAHWVTRMWSTRPEDLANAAEVSALPDDLAYFLTMIGEDYLPYLQANALAVQQGAHEVHYHAQGAQWRIPSAPYRAQCLNELKREFGALNEVDQGRVVQWLSDAAAERLRAPVTDTRLDDSHSRRLGRLGRPAGTFD